MTIETLALVIITLSGWLVALAVFGCYRAMRAIVNERAVEIRQLRATHDERLQQLRADRVARARDEQLARLEAARRALALTSGRSERTGGVSRW